MGYITVAHRKILRQLDSISYFPNGWDKFVKKQAIHHIHKAILSHLCLNSIFHGYRTSATIASSLERR